MPEIFIDMDGVLCDLRRAMHTAHGPSDLPYPYTDRTITSPVEWFENWLPQKSLWTSGPVLYEDFWYCIPMYDWAPDLIQQSKSLGSIRICSNPGRKDFAHAASFGKIRWCDHHLRIPSGRVILMRDKWLLSQPGRILIDDDDENIRLWRLSGGTGILFPQPWNEAHSLMDADPVAYVTRKIHEVSG